MAESKSLYELFVLGRLMSQPFHGYLLRQLLGVAIGPTRQISWGVLYPLIRRLEEGGLIESRPATGGPADRQRRGRAPATHLPDHRGREGASP